MYAAAKISDEFHEAWEEALDVGIDRHRGGTAQERAVTWRGTSGFPGRERRLAGSTEYSDNLMIFLLKAHRPKRFRENSTIEHRGAAPVTIVNQWVDPEVTRANELAGQPEGD